jgi:uncharacterized protein (DUF1697 family)
MGWAAFLRAINLGPRNKVPMALLREAFEEAGCTDVRTYIQSGNVLFRARGRDAAALGRRLERAVAETCGVKSTVVLRTWSELRRVVASHPFGADTSRSAVTFLAAKPTAAAVRRLRALDIAPDEVKVVGRDVYLRYPDGLQGSRLTGALLERELGVAGTNRNWRTVARLVEMVS